MVKIFLDTADVDEVREAVSWGVLDGVTTNPTLVAKTGRKFAEVVQDMLALVDGPVNLEVTSEDADSMIKEGRKLAKLHKNVVVKVQMTPEGLKAIRALSRDGIRVNTTLIFSANQALLAAKAGAKYVSPFIGRLDDIGQEGMEVVRQTVQIFRNYGIDCEVLVAKAGAKYVSPFIGRLDDIGQEGMEVVRQTVQIFRNYGIDCEVLVASIRHPQHVIDAALLGAHIVTMPFDVLKKMTQHALTDVGLKRFMDDWKKVPK